MIVTTWVGRVCVGVVSVVVSASGLTGVAQPAAAARTMSTRYIVNHLGEGAEHAAGYDRSMFSLWSDEGNGCDARDEVLIAEARTAPRVGAGCALSGGTWRSRYDGLSTGDASSFDIDHMVPLNEAWQSGAWSWSAATRKAYANDLGYGASLIAVSAHANRSKGDREPQDWMPERAVYACRYVRQWVAVKWRWHLTVNSAERAFLRAELRGCGWPRVPRPGRPSITMGSTTTGGGTEPAPAGPDPRFDFCYHAIAAGYGPYHRGADPEYDWYTDSDSDGIVCES